MFNDLLESRTRRERGISGHVASMLLHATAIALAVVATHRVVRAAESAPPEAISFVIPREPIPEPVQQPRPADAPVVRPPPRGFQILQSPIDIPDVLPAIDLTKPVTNPADFTAQGVPGGTADGVPGGVPRPVGQVPTYLQTQVEKVAALIPGTGTPEYPEALKNAGVEGEVHVSFVVDTTGRADVRTLNVLQSTHSQLTHAVLRAFPRMRFFPAEIGGNKVRQLVQLPFVFAIR